MENIEDQYEALSRHILRKCNELKTNKFVFGEISFTLEKDVDNTR